MKHSTVASHPYSLKDVETFALDLSAGRRIESAQPELILDPSDALQKNLQLLQGQSKVGIWFSKSADGRGFSLAARIREASSELELHALGAVHADMTYFFRRCGFDVCHLPQQAQILLDSKTSVIDQSLLRPFSRHYQTGADGESGLVGTPAAQRVAVLRSA